MAECVSLSATYTLTMDSLVILLLIVLIVLVIVLFKRLESKIDDLSVQSEIIKMRLTKMDGVGSVSAAAKKTPLPPPPPPPFVPSPSHFTPLPSVKTPPPDPEKKHEPEKESPVQAQQRTDRKNRLSTRGRDVERTKVAKHADRLPRKAAIVPYVPVP